VVESEGGHNIAWVISHVVIVYATNSKEYCSVIAKPPESKQKTVFLIKQGLNCAYSLALFNGEISKRLIFRDFTAVKCTPFSIGRDELVTRPITIYTHTV
jgi:hypothetical protein